MAWGHCGTGSGRNHSHVSTHAMQLQASQRTQSGAGVIHKITAHKVIMALALYLALRLTFPPWLQFSSMGPKSRCCHNQECKRGELRAAAHPAIKIKTVVGKPGIKMPAMPRPRLSTASARSSQRTSQWAAG